MGDFFQKNVPATDIKTLIASLKVENDPKKNLNTTVGETESNLNIKSEIRHKRCRNDKQSIVGCTIFDQNSNTQASMKKYFSVVKHTPDQHAANGDILNLLSSLKKNGDETRNHNFDDKSPIHTITIKGIHNCKDIQINTRAEQCLYTNTKLESISNHKKNSSNKQVELSCNNNKQLSKTNSCSTISKNKPSKITNCGGLSTGELKDIDKICEGRTPKDKYSNHVNYYRKKQSCNLNHGNKLDIIFMIKNMKNKKGNNENLDKLTTTKNTVSFDDFCNNVIKTINNSESQVNENVEKVNIKTSKLLNKGNIFPKYFSTGHIEERQHIKNNIAINNLPLTDFERSKMERCETNKVNLDDFVQNVITEINSQQDKISTEPPCYNLKRKYSLNYPRDVSVGITNMEHPLNPIKKKKIVDEAEDGKEKQVSHTNNNNSICSKAKNNNNNPDNVNNFNMLNGRFKDTKTNKLNISNCEDMVQNKGLDCKSGDSGNNSYSEVEDKSEDFLYIPQSSPQYFHNDVNSLVNSKEMCREIINTQSEINLSTEVRNFSEAMDTNNLCYDNCEQANFVDIDFPNNKQHVNHCSNSISPLKYDLHPVTLEDSRVCTKDNDMSKSATLCSTKKSSENSLYKHFVEFGQDKVNVLPAGDKVFKINNESNGSQLLEDFLENLVEENKKSVLKINKHTKPTRKKRSDIKIYKKGRMKIYKIRRLKKPKLTQKEQRTQKIKENLNFDDVFKRITQDIGDTKSNLPGPKSMSSISTSSSYVADLTKSEILSTGSNELTSPQQRLRKGINELSKDKSLLCPAKQWEDITSDNKDELKMKIQEVFLKVGEDFLERKHSTLKYRRQSFDNCIFKDKRLQLRPIEDSSMTVISSKHMRSQTRFKLTLYIMKKIQSLLETNTKLTKRELYYQMKTLVSDQKVIDRIINTISCLLNVGMWALNIIAQKGLVFGNLKILLASGETLNCNIRGTLIPQDISEIVEIHSLAYFILVVEKESIFYKLIDEGIFERLTRPFIMITGKGFPDLNTQLFLKKLWMIMSIPVFILVDADPHGINIMLNYRFGSVNNAHVSHHLAVPNAKWLGVYPSEVVNLNLAKQVLSERELKLVDFLLKTPYVESNHRIVNELKVLQEKKYKAEIEGLIKSDTFLTDVYLSNKFFTHNFI